MNTASPQALSSNLTTETVDRSAVSRVLKVLYSPGVVMTVIILAALLIRIWVVRHREMIMYDETMYVSTAKSIAAGESVDTTWTPLLPLMIAAAAQILRDYVLSGYAIVVTLGSLLCLPVFLLGRELFGRRIGMMAAALLAISPLFVDLSTEIYTETVYTFFLVFAVYFGWMTLKRPSIIRGALTGASLGLAYLANPATIYYVLVIAALVLIKAWKDSDRRMIAALAPLLIAVMLFATPYIYFLHHELGKWTYTGKDLYGNVYAADHGWLSEAGWKDGALALTDDGNETNVDMVRRTDGRQGVIEYTLTHLKSRMKALENSIDSFETQLAPNVMFIGMLPLIGLGIFAGEWDRKRVRRFGYLLLMVAPALFIFIFWFNGTSRIFMPFVPFLLLWAGAGWYRIEQWGKSISGLYLKPGALHLTGLIPWLVGAAILLPVLPIIHEKVSTMYFPLEYKEAGEWIKANAGPGKIVMSMEYAAPFYADGQDQLFPYADNVRLTRYAQAHKVDYLVIDQKDLSTFRPQISTLATDQAIAGEWQLVARLHQGAAYETFIYRLSDKGGGSQA